MVSSPVRLKVVDPSPASKIKPFNAPITAGGRLNWPQLPTTALFGTDGIRDRADRLLSAPFAMQVGFWAGQTFRTLHRPGPVIVGQDSRNSSDMLAAALTAGLTAAGVDVWQLGLCPTPCVAHLTRQGEAMGGIMISASHNPPEDNGIKFFGHEGTKLSDHATQTIETCIRQAATGTPAMSSDSSWGKAHARHDLVGQYSNFLRQTLPSALDLSGLRIVLDLAWGAAVSVAELVFRGLGAEVIALHAQADGDRINVNCGSTHLQTLQTAIIEHQADIGFAFDGDADRVMAVDNQGRIVDGDYLLYLWGQTLMTQGRLPEQHIVATVMANLGFERAWQSVGGQFTRTAVGDRHVQAEMWRTGAMLGGEQSGHILCHHHSVSGDGIQTALHLCAIVQQSGQTLAQLREQSFKTYPQKLQNVRVECPDRRSSWKNCDVLQQAIAHAEREMGDQGRILVRASGTEPVIRVMVEASCDQTVNHWTEQLVQVVEQNLAA